MSIKITYEWDVETVKECGDVYDHYHWDTYQGCVEYINTVDPPEGCHYRIVLVRDKWDDCLGFVDRGWAYVEDGNLDEWFTGCMADWVVPGRFHKEVENSFGSLPASHTS